MSKSRLRHFIFCTSVLVGLCTACHETVTRRKNPVFTMLDSSVTGLNFVNRLTPTKDFNVFHYMYFYNGGGVGAGDFNNDGLIDLFFTANQGDDKIYLNKGNLKFADVTKEAHIPQDSAWSTGVSIVDINNDGLLDIYICRVGNYEKLQSKNQLLVCQGIDKNGVPFYKDEAKEYGLDFSGFSTQAVFFDYDGDGDLDMFLLNHSVHQNGTFAERKNFLGTYHPLSGDRLYRNDGNKFTDVTRESKINSSAISYGLGVAAADIDLDGYPDLYIGNDFHENDYLYINQKDGTFKDELNDRIMHTSQFSMGVDVADINNDAYPEIISMDMLPSDRYILKRSLGEDDYDIFNLKIKYGYNYQYTRNNLQLNRRNGMFSEVGLYAGIAATDWSWSPLWMDFDNDGRKDLFISNGIPKRLNDIDYVNYVSNSELQEKIATKRINEADIALIDKFPQIKLPNKFFRNLGNASFDNLEGDIENNLPSYSNGAIYADLDNDGDLDVVVNNIDDVAKIYLNRANDKKTRPSLEIKLKGPEKNINALGAKVILYTKTDIRTYEKFPVRGFQSCMEEPIHIGIASTAIDSLLLIWPDNTYQHLEYKKNQQNLTVFYRTGLPRFDYSKLRMQTKTEAPPMVDITRQTGIDYRHEENPFNEFDREPLIPHMISREGPALAVGDFDGNGLEDVFMGASKGNKGAIFIQNSSGKFTKSVQPSLDNDSTYEDVAACWVDINNDHHLDLVVASGGNEYYGKDQFLRPRLYLNDGAGHLNKMVHAFDSLYVNASCVVANDFNGDGFQDIFIGGRSVPWAYGEIPRSYLLQNDGKGNFTDVTEKIAEGLGNIGFVTNAVWADLDNDGDKDLVLSLEWGGICAFINNKGKFTRKMLTEKKGWWNFIVPCDINGDGRIDFIAGNLGLNSRLKASPKEPVHMYYYDFDGNGKKDQVLTYYLGGNEIPFANKDELQKQMPFLKKKYLYAEDFAKASLEDMFTAEKLNDASVLTADYFENAILINQGNLNFSVQALPWQAQLSPYRDALPIIGNNGVTDILLVGNFYPNNIQMGRNDADFGTILLNNGKGNIKVESFNGVQVKGEVRHIQKIAIGGKESYILARNNDSAVILQLKTQTNKKMRG